MTKNHYSKIIEKKSNLELENMISENSVYTKDAIQAAIWEIEKRKQNIENTPNSERKEFESDREIILQTEIIETESDDEEFVLDDPSLPELYTKNTIFFVSAIFSTFFGAVLLSSNLKYTKNSSKWIEVTLIGFAFSLLLFFLVIIFGLNLFIIVSLNIFGSKVLTEHLWNRYIGKDFKHRSKKIIFI
ncbi:hypothetical protein [Lutibacter sp. HS1-25]|uniref:hypothetical protein n=1 Tax=Lutibacter sp. HS1-25 TaxID=2485000 RepID=UPI001010F67E|nr:hypothetical protein [Lutibacter sp. HS1-25]